MIDCDCCYHRLAGSGNPGTEQRLIWSMEPSRKLGGIEKPLTCPFLSATYEIRLLSRKIRWRYPSQELAVPYTVLVLLYRIKSRFYSGNVGPNEARVVFDCLR